MTTCKIGLIGAGGRSGQYATYYQDYDDIEVVAMVDPIEEHRKLTIKNAGLKPDCKEYSDWLKMLDDNQDLDGVIITTPKIGRAHV